MGTLSRLALAFALTWPFTASAGPPAEGDGDGIPDVLDTCTVDSRNLASPCDTDSDGYGNVCDPDFDQNFSVNVADFAMYFVPAFKSGAPTPQGTDMDCNEVVNAADFGMYFVPKFKGLPAVGGAVPGPSGLACAGTVPCE